MLNVKLDTRPWSRKFDRIGVAVKQMPRIEIVAPGQEQKVAAAKERGDEFPVPSDDAMELAASLLAEGVADLANTGGTSLRETAQQIGDHIAEDIADQITSGQIDGPPRSREWVKRKGHDKNLLGLTGDLGGSLTAKLRSR